MLGISSSSSFEPKLACLFLVRFIGTSNKLGIFFLVAWGFDVGMGVGFWGLGEGNGFGVLGVEWGGGNRCRR